MVSPKDGTGVKTNLIYHERFSFFEIVEKKESYLTTQGRCLTEQSKKRQQNKVRKQCKVRQAFGVEIKKMETYSK